MKGLIKVGFPHLGTCILLATTFNTATPVLICKCAMNVTDPLAYHHL